MERSKHIRFGGYPFKRLGWSHLLDVSFVCKSFYKATLEPQCWEHLIFPSYINPHDIWENSSFISKRRAIKYHKKNSTALVKFVVNRRCGNAPLSSPRKSWIMLQTNKVSLLLHYYYEKEKTSF